MKRQIQNDTIYAITVFSSTGAVSSHTRFRGNISGAKTLAGVTEHTGIVTEYYENDMLKYGFYQLRHGGNSFIYPIDDLGTERT